MAKSADLYETDFYCWTVENAALLRARKFEQIDLEHIAEEIEDMGRRDRREVHSRMATLVAHLLKWRFQPERRNSSWEITIFRERKELALTFRQSPSLLRYARDQFGDIFRLAVEEASRETGIPVKSLPGDCPFTFEQILDRDYLPG